MKNIFVLIHAAKVSLLYVKLVQQMLKSVKLYDLYTLTTISTMQKLYIFEKKCKKFKVNDFIYSQSSKRCSPSRLRITVPS